MKAVHTLPLAFVLASSFGLAHAADTSSKTMEAKPVAATAANTANATSNAMSNTTAGRNWSRIDLNRDNLVSPEEMEAYLQANPGPLRGK